MIELHLIGYTEDAGYLVFDTDAEGEGRYALAVDPDLLATVEAVRERRIATGGEVEERPTPEPAAASEVPASPVRTRPPQPASGTEAAALGRNGQAEAEVAAASVETRAAVNSRLSPADIQAQLRAGRSVRALARDAGTDPAWIERWQAPILAERDRVLADARARRIDQPRARPLGGSVERALADRGVEPESARWQVSRRDDGRWRITVRFDDDGRLRSATWLLDPAQPHLRAQSPLATELASPRRRDRPRRR